MTELPVVTGRAVMKAFRKDGWVVVRRRGSHVVMTKAGRIPTLSIPVHAGRAIAKGTLRGLIRDAGLSVEEFVKLLRG